MSYGDWRDGAALSFSPKPRTSTARGRAAGVLLLIAGLGLAVLGVGLHMASDEIRNMNVLAPGVLIGYVEGADGSYAQVSFEVPGNPSTTISREPVEFANPNTVGRTFNVFYDPEDVSRTFIEGIDQLAAPVFIYAAAVIGFLMGVVMTIKPPENTVGASRARRP